MSKLDINKMRNIGISAHIDSGKTTFTERVLFYGGRIDSIHEVKGGDNVGAKMDSMELEREKGITIQSASTHLTWKEHHVNIIDTPGHVDFTIEVERALRVLDGAVLIVCSSSGVQPQTLTVDKQMKRYKVPRLVFLNKMDRMGADPWRAIQQVRDRLGLNCAAVQVNIGESDSYAANIDLLELQVIKYEGKNGEQVVYEDIPEQYQQLVNEKRQELIEKVGEVDTQLEEMYLNEEEITTQALKEAIQRTTKAMKFAPVYMGSAYKNKGVQSVLDGVLNFLPNPTERPQVAFREEEGQEIEFTLEVDRKKPLVAFAFKLDENKFGQLTFIRVYQGRIKKGDYVYNQGSQKRMKVSRMVKMHSNEMEDISEVGAGDIFALFGLECSTGDTITDDNNHQHKISCSNIFVPTPVISLSIKPVNKRDGAKFQKALNKFQREDPTFQVGIDGESEEIIISGMGELHLQIYAERIRRESDIEVELGQPTVNYRETISNKASFDYLHKKQSGGAGQYARVMGEINLLPTIDGEFSNQFVNKVVGGAIPNEYITAVEKAFYECVKKGPLTGYPVVNIKYTLEGGVTHPVDSSQNAFNAATKYSFALAMDKANALIMEPIMTVEVACPKENYSQVMAGLSKRRGLMTNTETRGDLYIMTAEVPLANMFGYATELRGSTQGTGEFSMDYKSHDPVPPDQVEMLKEKFRKQKEERG